MSFSTATADYDSNRTHQRLCSQNAADEPRQSEKSKSQLVAVKLGLRLTSPALGYPAASHTRHVFERSSTQRRRRPMKRPLIWCLPVLVLLVSAGCSQANNT